MVKLSAVRSLNRTPGDVATTSSRSASRRARPSAPGGQEQQTWLGAELADTQGERGDQPGGDVQRRGCRAASGQTTTALTAPSSPKNGMGTGRAAAMSARARPPFSDPVKPDGPDQRVLDERAAHVPAGDQRDGVLRGAGGRRTRGERLEDRAER